MQQDLHLTSFKRILSCPCPFFYYPACARGFPKIRGFATYCIFNCNGGCVYALSQSGRAFGKVGGLGWWGMLVIPLCLRDTLNAFFLRVYYSFAHSISQKLPKPAICVADFCFDFACVFEKNVQNSCIPIAFAICTLLCRFVWIYVWQSRLPKSAFRNSMWSYGSGWLHMRFLHDFNVDSVLKGFSHCHELSKLLGFIIFKVHIIVPSRS